MTIDNTPATLSLELYGKKVTWETDHSDLTADELAYAFYGMLVAQGFMPKSVTDAMNGVVSEMKEEMKEENE